MKRRLMQSVKKTSENMQVFIDFSSAGVVFVARPLSYPLFCNSSILDAFHSDPFRKEKQ